MHFFEKNAMHTVFYGNPDHDGHIDHFARLCIGEEINAYRASKHILKASQLFLSTNGG